MTFLKKISRTFQMKGHNHYNGDLKTCDMEDKIATHVFVRDIYRSTSFISLVLRYENIGTVTIFSREASSIPIDT